MFAGFGRPVSVVAFVVTRQGERDGAFRAEVILLVQGKPNAAGWLLPPGGNVHRRYPDVAILIPNTKGRACGGLCTSCQRMYNFQKGNLNFNLEKLAPRKAWKQKLVELMDYFEGDSKIRDILITGGDALMNTDKSLKRILDAVYDMAVRKIENNKKNPC